MRILFLTMQYGDGYFQGTERYLDRLVAGLADLGHLTHVIAGDPEMKAPANNGSLTTIPTGTWMAVDGVARAQIGSVMDRFKPDVLHVLNPAHVGIDAMNIAKERGIPVVITTMDYWWVCPTHTLLKSSGEICSGSKSSRECAVCISQRHHNPMARALAAVPVLRAPGSIFALGLSASRNGVSREERERWRDRGTQITNSVRGCDHIIFPSAATESVLGPVLRGPRTTRIPYGIDAHWFTTARTPRVSIDPQSVRIGYAGALMEHKGVHHLLQAMHDLGWAQTLVSIAGTGTDSYTSKLRELADGLRVRFLGRLDARSMQDFYREIDVLVVPSTWPENLPIVTLEATAAAVPVIASDVAGHRGQIPPDALFEPGNPEGITDMLMRWVGNGNLPPIARKPETTRVMVRKTLEIYEQVSLSALQTEH